MANLPVQKEEMILKAGHKTDCQNGKPIKNWNQKKNNE